MLLLPITVKIMSNEVLTIQKAVEKMLGLGIVKDVTRIIELDDNILTYDLGVDENKLGLKLIGKIDLRLNDIDLICSSTDNKLLVMPLNFKILEDIDDDDIYSYIQISTSENSPKKFIAERRLYKDDIKSLIKWIPMTPPICLPIDINRIGLTSIIIDTIKDALYERQCTEVHGYYINENDGYQYEITKDKLYYVQQEYTPTISMAEFEEILLNKNICSTNVISLAGNIMKSNFTEKIILSGKSLEESYRKEKIETILNAYIYIQECMPSVLFKHNLTPIKASIDIRINRDGNVIIDIETKYNDIIFTITDRINNPSIDFIYGLYDNDNLLEYIKNIIRLAFTDRPDNIKIDVYNTLLIKSSNQYSVPKIKFTDDELRLVELYNKVVLNK